MGAHRSRQGVDVGVEGCSKTTQGQPVKRFNMAQPWLQHEVMSFGELEDCGQVTSYSLFLSLSWWVMCLFLFCFHFLSYSISFHPPPSVPPSSATSSLSQSVCLCFSFSPFYLFSGHTVLTSPQHPSIIDLPAKLLLAGW